MLAERGATADEAIFEITTDDVRAAADVFRHVYDETNGVDGRVSIEVSPDLAHDTDATIARPRSSGRRSTGRTSTSRSPPPGGPARDHRGDRPGISVNVTLIFSLERYAGVIDAYLAGPRAGPGGRPRPVPDPLRRLVLRVARRHRGRQAADRDRHRGAEALKSKAGIENARLAYELFEREFATDRAKELLDAGANVQRPLWASTGVKDPSLPDTLYVTELVAPGTVNTMPEKTLEATFDHGVIEGDNVTGAYAEAHEYFDALPPPAWTSTTSRTLEDEGVDKFIASWHELQETVATALKGGVEAAR